MENLKNTALLERLEIKRKVGVLIHVHSSDPTKLSQPDSLLQLVLYMARCRWILLSWQPYSIDYIYLEYRSTI